MAEIKSGITTTEFKALAALTLLVVGNYTTVQFDPPVLDLDIPETILMSLTAAWAHYGHSRTKVKSPGGLDGLKAAIVNDLKAAKGG